MLVPLVMIAPVLTLTGIVYCSDMSWLKPSSEAPSHLIISVSFLPSFSEIIVSSNVLIHLLEKVLQGLGGFLAKFCAIGPRQSPLTMASMTISFGIVGA
jgi:hypothetical protein